MLMGMNLYNVGNCLPHRMQYPIGAATGTSHAAGLAALYPVWIGAEYKFVSDKVIDIFQALVKRTPHNASEAEELMADFLAEHEINTNLAELGIREEQIPTLVKEIRGDISADPLGGEAGICERLCRKAMNNSCG